MFDFGPPHELDLCPHSAATSVHTWHGLPHSWIDCAGSHLPAELAVGGCPKARHLAAAS